MKATTTDNAKPEGLAPTMGSVPSISGARLRCLIQNVHAIVRAKYRRTPLWALVADITGHGSTVSTELCRALNLDPHQNAGERQLLTLNTEL